jgi:cob(I)alamin adenosyltransferase
MSDVPLEGPDISNLTRVKSLVLINTGDGKGKTTAAMGVVVRAVARGWKAIVLQFIKSDEWKYGEAKVLGDLGVPFEALGDGFTWDSEDLEHTKALAREAWRRAAEAIDSGYHNLVVLDEVTYPITWGWIEIDDVVATIANRPEHVNIVITGRNAHPALIAIAHTVTEMRSITPAFDDGIATKKGIDY